MRKLRVLVTLMFVAALMAAKDTTSTKKTSQCKGCCPEGSHKGLLGIQHTTCSKCSMTNHENDCARRP